MYAQESMVPDPPVASIKSDGSPLHNGILYKHQKSLPNSTAYLDDLNYFKIGSVVYDGHSFENVLLMYDLVSDLLVTSTQDGLYMYSLITDKTSAFNIDGHHFVKLVMPEKSSIKSGFFELLYDKELKVYLKRTKIFKEVIDRAGVISSYGSNVNYYLKRGETYYEITNQNSLLKLFKEKRKEIKKYMNEREISFSENPTKAIITLVSFYDSLPK